MCSDCDKTVCYAWDSCALDPNCPQFEECCEVEGEDSLES